MATETDIREALRHVVDPEIGVNIIDLGLVYRIEVGGARAHITMTMTSPACPLADYLKNLVDHSIDLRTFLEGTEGRELVFCCSPVNPRGGWTWMSGGPFFSSSDARSS
jgi:metal-sulfur cluster biosynthetic enzyme